MYIDRTKVYNGIYRQMSTISNFCDKILDMITSYINILTHMHTYEIVISKIYASISHYKETTAILVIVRNFTCEFKSVHNENHQATAICVIEH